MTLNIPGTLATAVQYGKVHRAARCWQIDSVVDSSRVLRFTDHHTILTLSSGLNFTPLNGMSATAQSRQSDLDETSRETRGIISDAAITEKDLIVGFWEGAKVTEYTVDWMYPFRGAIQETVYWIEGTEFDKDTWRATIIGLTQFLSEPTGDHWQPTCRVDLFSQGDFKCNANSSSFLANRSVTTTFGSDPKLELSMNSALPNAATADYYTDGTVTFTSGDNVGVVREIASVDVTGVEVTLREPVEYDPTGDTVNVLPGCNKQPGITDSTGHCKNKFSNLVNFQAEPFIPGRDQSIKGASFV